MCCKTYVRVKIRKSASSECASAGNFNIILSKKFPFDQVGRMRSMFTTLFVNVHPGVQVVNAVVALWKSREKDGSVK